MTATLPPMPVEECRECHGGAVRYEAGGDIRVTCWRCNGEGKTEALPPSRCPWCWSACRTTIGLTHWQNASGIRVYTCANNTGERAPAATYDRHFQKWSTHPCPATPDDVAAVSRDLATERGLDLLRALTGRPRQLPKVANRDAVPQACPGCGSPQRSRPKKGHYRGLYDCAARYQNRSGRMRKRPSDCPRFGIDREINALLAIVREPNALMPVRGIE